MNIVLITVATIVALVFVFVPESQVYGPYFFLSAGAIGALYLIRGSRQ
jgi:hypothetical protein